MKPAARRHGEAVPRERVLAVLEPARRPMGGAVTGQPAEFTVAASDKGDAIQLFGCWMWERWFFGGSPVPAYWVGGRCADCCHSIQYRIGDVALPDFAGRLDYLACRMVADLAVAHFIVKSGAVHA